MGRYQNTSKSLITAVEEELASEFHKRLVDHINEFDEQLDQEHEVGMRLVSFGQSIQFAVRDIGYYNPKLICFYGELDNGSKVQLIQHVNQISFLLLLFESKPLLPKQPILVSLQSETLRRRVSLSQSGEEVKYFFIVRLLDLDNLGFESTVDST